MLPKIFKITNERLVLNSPWVDFGNNQFSKTMKSLEVDQSDMLHTSRFQRKCDFADCQKTKDTACTVLQKWQTYLILENGSLWMCCCWGKGHSHQERPLSLLAAWPPTPPAFLSLSGLCSLISELESPTSAKTIFRWGSTESVQEAQVCHESMGLTDLIIIECRWFLTARGTTSNGRCFPTFGQWYHRRNKAICHGQLPHHSAH